MSKQTQKGTTAAGGKPRVPGETVLVTGASSGFGEMIALALGRAGYVVYASMRESAGRNKDKAGEYSRISGEEGIDIRPLDMDVTQQDSVDAAVDTIIAQSGRIDMLVHNVGHMSLGPAEAFTVEQLARIHDVNTLGTQRVNRAVLPHMRTRGRGLLVWVSSSSVKGNWSPWLGPYFAAKAAMEQLAVSYAAEVARFGIESVLIVPGAFTTGTNHFRHAMKPADANVASVYAQGPTSDLEEKVLAGTRLLEPGDVDPTEVGRAVLRVVQAPYGKRPFRTTIDPSQDGSEIVSAVQDRFRRDTLFRIGLDDLLHPSTDRSRA